MKANPHSPDYGAGNDRELLIAEMREIIDRLANTGKSRVPWEGDWRLAIAEERVAMAEARLRQVEDRIKSVK
jgi:hypothetical protein